MFYTLRELPRARKATDSVDEPFAVQTIDKINKPILKTANLKRMNDM
jgi:hypothetical protein